MIGHTRLKSISIRIGPILQKGPILFLFCRGGKAVDVFQMLKCIYRVSQIFILLMPFYLPPQPREATEERLSIPVDQFFAHLVAAVHL